MKDLYSYSRILVFNLLLIFSFISFAQTDPPENFYVTPIGMASWDSIQNDDFQFYKVFLDGVFITDVDSVSYQYGSNGEELEPGESYYGEIAALYNAGLSEKVGFEFVYLPCDSFPNHTMIDAFNLEGSNDVMVLWSDSVYFTPIYEDFEGGTLPDEWSMVTNSSAGWFITEDGSSSNWEIPEVGGFYACSNDDAANDDGSMDYLITPELTFFGLTEINLSFLSFFDGQYDQIATVEISFDGGSSWEVVTEVQANDEWTEVQLDLSEYAGQINVWLAFHSNDSEEWASGWAIDNVSITAAKNKKENYSHIGTNIYLDDELISFVPTPDTFHIIEDFPPYGYHDLCISKVFSNDNGAHTWTSCYGELCIYDIGTGWPCLPPENLIVETFFSEGRIQLEWESPYGNIWFQYDNGYNLDSLYVSQEFWFAAKWDTEQLNNLNGAYINSIKFFPKDTTVNATLMVWQGENANNLIYEQAISSIDINQWNYYNFEDPLPINNNDHLWVGFYIESSNHFAGVGTFTGNPNSDLFSTDGINWERLTDYSISYSWNLGVELGFFEYDSILGYNIYRDHIQINTDLVQDNVFSEFQDLHNGYCYHVSAIYLNCGESDFSNEACSDFLWSINELNTIITLVPNPAKTHCKIESTDQISSIQIYNQIGQQVYTKENININAHIVDLTPFESGIYFIEVQNNNRSQISKLIIQH
jgi:hypothetical protein